MNFSIHVNLQHKYLNNALHLIATNTFTCICIHKGLHKKGYISFYFHYPYPQNKERRFIITPHDEVNTKITIAPVVAEVFTRKEGFPANI